MNQRTGPLPDQHRDFMAGRRVLVDAAAALVDVIPREISESMSYSQMHVSREDALVGAGRS
jgi:hypothetical protein